MSAIPAAGRPPQPRLDTRLRVALGVSAAAAALVGATGLSQGIAFASPSTLKYALTVGGPLLVLAAVVSQDPVRPLAVAAILAAPFAGFTATFGSLSMSPLVPLLVLATGAALVSGPRPRPLSALGIAGAWALVLLAAPIGTGSAASHYAVLLAAAATMAWIASRVAATRGGLEAVLGAFVASAALQSLLAIWEYQTGNELQLYGGAAEPVFGPDYFFGFAGEVRPSGALYDPISYGNIVALACPIAFGLALGARSAWMRVGAAVAAVVCALGLSVSLSRMSWIGAIAGLAVAVWLFPAGRRLRATLAVGLAAVLVGTVAYRTSEEAFALRFSSISEPTSANVATAGGDRQRIELWHAAADTAADHPLFGVGFGEIGPELAARVATTGSETHAHSTYLQLLAEGGLAAVLALLLVFGATMRSLRDALRGNRTLAAGLCGAFAALLVVWSTDFVIRYTPVAATVAVIFGAAAAQARRRETAA